MYFFGVLEISLGNKARRYRKSSRLYFLQRHPMQSTLYAVQYQPITHTTEKYDNYHAVNGEHIHSTQPQQYNMFTVVKTTSSAIMNPHFTPIHQSNTPVKRPYPHQPVSTSLVKQHNAIIPPFRYPRKILTYAIFRQNVNTQMRKTEEV